MRIKHVAIVLVVVLGALVVFAQTRGDPAELDPFVPELATAAPTFEVTVSNFPDPQNVTGTVNVGNLPSTQAVSGTVSIANLPAVQQVTGTVAVSNLGTTDPTIMPLRAGPGAVLRDCGPVHGKQALREKTN